jgi:hypothetical protein
LLFDVLGGDPECLCHARMCSGHFSTRPEKIKKSRSMEVAQMAESEPQIAGLLLQLVPVHRCGYHRCQQATVPESPMPEGAGCDRGSGAMESHGINGRSISKSDRSHSKTVTLSRCQAALVITICSTHSL